MTTSYDASVVGGLRCRASRIIVEFPANDVPVVHVEQYSAVTMNDNSTQQIAPMQSLEESLDLVDNGNTPIPLVDFTTGAPVLVDGVAQTTTLNTVLVQMLAVIRSIQLANNP